METIDKWTPDSLRSAVLRCCAEKQISEFQLSTYMAMDERDIKSYLAGTNHTLRMFRAAERFCAREGIEPDKGGIVIPNGKTDPGLAKPGNKSIVVTKQSIKAEEAKRNEEEGLIIPLGGIKTVDSLKTASPFPEGFVVVRPRSSRLWTITVLSNDIMLSRGLNRELGNPKFLRFAIHTKGPIFAILPCDEKDDAAIPMRNACRVSRTVVPFFSKLPRGRYTVTKHSDADCYVAYAPKEEKPNVADPI